MARMEAVLERYAEAPDPLRPVVCFDETPRQLIGEARVPVAARPGRPPRVDYECSILSAFGASGKSGAVHSPLSALSPLSPLSPLSRSFRLGPALPLWGSA